MVQSIPRLKGLHWLGFLNTTEEYNHSLSLDDVEDEKLEKSQGACIRPLGESCIVLILIVDLLVH